MTHEYTVATGGTVLAAGDPADVPPTAIAWAADRVLAVGSDADVRAISRGDSTFLAMDGCAVTPAPSDPAAAQRLVRTAIGSGRAFDTVAVLLDAGLLAPGATIETGSPADLAFWSADPRTVPQAVASSVRIVAIVRAGAFTQGDDHAGPSARLSRLGAEHAPSPGTPEWLGLAAEFNDGAGARHWREVLDSAAYLDACDETLALWREVFDDWLIQRGLSPVPGSFTDVLRVLGLPNHH